MKKKSANIDTDPGGSSTMEVLCRGLVGYVSYLGACRGSPVYSEQLLYEPILRIGYAQGYRVSCEVPVKKPEQIGKDGKVGKGDHPRIDFDFTRINPAGTRFGLEVKWTDKATVGVSKDIAKLERHAKKNACTGYVLIFGPHDAIDELKMTGLGTPIRKSKLIGWKAGKTKYAARWYRVV